MPGRTFNPNAYRYGQNTQEKDNEIFEGAYTAEYWEYDSRLGRRWNIDPKPQISISDFACFKNNPIVMTDIRGDSPGEKDKTKQGQGTAQVTVLPGGGAKNSGETDKFLLKEEINKAIKGDPSASVTVTGLPGPSTPVTGKSAGFAAVDAKVGFNYTTQNTVVKVNGAAEPDAFIINGNISGTYPTAPGSPDGDNVSPAIPISGDINVITVKGKFDKVAGAVPGADPKVQAAGDSWSIDGAGTTINYTYEYTQWPVSRPSTQAEVNAFLAGNPTRPMVADPSSPTLYRTQTGVQFAPPGVPGAKPLLQHGIGYIFKYLVGGYNSVDKSK